MSGVNVAGVLPAGAEGIPSMAYDRLQRLSTFRLILRTHNFKSPQDVLTATPERLKTLHRYRADVVRLVRDDHPVVIRLLFTPASELEWQVAQMSSQPGARILSLSIGKTRVFSEIYRVDDGGEAEKRAWAQLVAALPPLRPTGALA